MDDGCLEGGGLCVDRVKVEGVVVARQLGEQLNITGGECFGEGGSLSDVEQPTGGRSCSDRREAETRATNDSSPHETHPEENCDPPLLLQSSCSSRLFPVSASRNGDT